MERMMRRPRNPVGFVDKTELPRMRRQLVRKPIPRLQRKRRRRIPLRHDTTPAAPVVTRLFNDLQLVRSFQTAIDAGEYRSNQSDEVRAEFEREAWSYLIEYLVTLEAPDFLHEPEMR